MKIMTKLGFNIIADKTGLNFGEAYGYATLIMKEDPEMSRGAGYEAKLSDEEVKWLTDFWDRHAKQFKEQEQSG